MDRLVVSGSCVFGTALMMKLEGTLNCIHYFYVTAISYGPPFVLSGEAINLAYMPVLVPVGVIGNVLSFMVRFASLFRIVTVMFGVDSVKTRKKKQLRRQLQIPPPS